MIYYNQLPHISSSGRYEIQNLGKSQCSMVLLTLLYTHAEWQKWGYQNSKTPKTIVTKFGMGNYYVGDMAPHAKIQTETVKIGT